MMVWVMGAAALFAYVGVGSVVIGLLLRTVELESVDLDRPGVRGLVGLAVCTWPLFVIVLLVLWVGELSIAAQEFLDS